VGYAEETMLRRFVCALAVAATGASGQVASGRISGTVVDKTNLGIPGVLVTIERPMPMAGAVADAAGRFVIAGVPPGMYTLRIQAAGFLAKELEVQIEDAKEISLGRLTLDVPVPPPCLESAKTPRTSEIKLPVGGKPRVWGSAQGETGGALRGVTVTLLVRGTSKVIATTSSSEGGEFLFVDVKPGNYDVEAFSKGFELAKVPNLQVRKGHEVVVRLTWTQGEICL
jgi:hypothetical protein